MDEELERLKTRYHIACEAVKKAAAVRLAADQELKRRSDELDDCNTALQGYVFKLAYGRWPEVAPGWTGPPKPPPSSDPGLHTPSFWDRILPRHGRAKWWLRWWPV